MTKTQNQSQQYILNALKDAEREGSTYLSEESLYRACVRTCPGALGWNAFLADKAALLRLGVLRQAGERVYMPRSM